MRSCYYERAQTIISFFAKVNAICRICHDFYRRESTISCVSVCEYMVLYGAYNYSDLDVLCTRSQDSSLSVSVLRVLAVSHIAWRGIRILDYWI